LHWSPLLLNALGEHIDLRIQYIMTLDIVCSPVKLFIMPIKISL
jgi:hypothetical protein